MRSAQQQASLAERQLQVVNYFWVFWQNFGFGFFRATLECSDQHFYKFWLFYSPNFRFLIQVCEKFCCLNGNFL